MQRRSGSSELASEMLRERLVSVIDSGLSVDDQLRHLSVLRPAGLPEEIDRLLVERIGQLRSGLQIAQQKQAEFNELIDKLTAPPYFPAIYFNTIETENGPSAIVRQGAELRAVSLGDSVEAETLTRFRLGWSCHSVRDEAAKLDCLRLPRPELVTCKHDTHEANK